MNLEIRIQQMMLTYRQRMIREINQLIMGPLRQHPLIHLLPRRIHWSVNLKRDPRARYGAHANPHEIASHVGHAAG